MNAKTILLIVVVAGVVIGVVALIVYVTNNGDSVGHWDAQFKETCTSIQGSEKCVFAEPEQFKSTTFHLQLPGGQSVSTSTAPPVATSMTPTPLQPITVTVTQTVPVSTAITWTVVNPDGCTCRNRNEVGDPTTDLACTNGAQLQGGTSMSVFCPSTESWFYFERIVR